MYLLISIFWPDWKHTMFWLKIAWLYVIAPEYFDSISRIIIYTDCLHRENNISTTYKHSKEFRNIWAFSCSRVWEIAWFSEKSGKGWHCGSPPYSLYDNGNSWNDLSLSFFTVAWGQGLHTLQRYCDDQKNYKLLDINTVYMMMDHGTEESTDLTVWMLYYTTLFTLLDLWPWLILFRYPWIFSPTVTMHYIWGSVMDVVDAWSQK